MAATICTDGPRTVEVDLRNLLQYEATSVVLSHLVYGGQKETQRERFQRTLGAWALLERAKIDGKWAREPLPVRPTTLLNVVSCEGSFLKAGMRTLYRRSSCAFLMVAPHMPTIDGKLPRRIDGFFPSVENMAKYAKKYLGYGATEDVSAFKHKVWRPTKPVAHLGHALFSLIWAVDLTRKEDGNYEDSQDLCNRDPLLAIFFYPELLEMLLVAAEEARIALPKIKQFRIRSSDTIQFVCRRAVALGDSCQ